MANNKPIIARTPDNIGNPQVNFDRKQFDDFITNKGYRCHIERAMRCPCTADGTNGQANSDCRNCFGTGWFFIEKTETIITCTSMSNRNKYEVWSTTNMGIVNISTRPQDKLGYMDRVTLIELDSWFSQVLPLKKSISEPSKYFAFLIYEPNNIYNVYLHVDSNSPLKSLKPSEYTIVNNVIKISEEIVEEYVADGKPKISIRYTHFPVYHIIDINRDLIKQKTGTDCATFEDKSDNFPLNCVGKRAHYMLDAQNYSGQSVFDNTDYSKIQNYDV